MVATGQMWPLNSGNVANDTEKLNFNFHLIVYKFN